MKVAGGRGEGMFLEISCKTSAHCSLANELGLFLVGSNGSICKQMVDPMS